MSISYFILEKGIVERDDLSIYEKMCCVVLAKWAAEEREGFDTLTLAREMSCTERKASETIRQLKQKGFIESEGRSEIAAPPKVIKAENVEGLEPVRFNVEEMKEKPLSREALMSGVQEIIEETINDSEARIILNFAGDDLDKVKRCYKIAKNMQISDTIEALIIELQRKEKPPATLENINGQVEKPLVEAPRLVVEEEDEDSQMTMETKQLLQEIKLPEVPEGLEVPDVMDIIEEGTVGKPSLKGYPSTIKEPLVEDTKPVADATEMIQEKSERPWYLDDDDELDDVIKPPSTQINANMINKMKAYKRYGK